MPIYSNSKLQTYENCPQQYKLRYIDKVELPEGREKEIIRVSDRFSIAQTSAKEQKSKVQKSIVL